MSEKELKKETILSNLQYTLQFSLKTVNFRSSHNLLFVIGIMTLIENDRIYRKWT